MVRKGVQDPFVGVSSLLQTTSSCLRSKPFMRVQIHGHWCISMKHHLPCAWSGLMRELHPLLSMSRRACRRHNNFPSVDRHRPLDSAQGISTPLWKMEKIIRTPASLISVLWVRVQPRLVVASFPFAVPRGGTWRSRTRLPGPGAPSSTKAMR